MADNHQTVRVVAFKWLSCKVLQSTVIGHLIEHVYIVTVEAPSVVGYHAFSYLATECVFQYLLKYIWNV